ncbi:hypothetical protein LXA43DRAFT_159385 [Ganoderma leucocontextum]|nr:hypothetical protein LXA43DRAFT_159385 [Ganoderma leucocontextum]
MDQVGPTTAPRDPPDHGCFSSPSRPFYANRLAPRARRHRKMTAAKHARSTANCAPGRPRPMGSSSRLQRAMGWVAKIAISSHCPPAARPRHDGGQGRSGQGSGGDDAGQDGIGLGLHCWDRGWRRPCTPMRRGAWRHSPLRVTSITVRPGRGGVGDMEARMRRTMEGSEGRFQPGPRRLRAASSARRETAPWQLMERHGGLPRCREWGWMEM